MKLPLDHDAGLALSADVWEVMVCSMDYVCTVNCVLGLIHWLWSFVGVSLRREISFCEKFFFWFCLNCFVGVAISVVDILCFAVSGLQIPLSNGDGKL